MTYFNTSFDAECRGIRYVVQIENGFAARHNKIGAKACAVRARAFGFGGLNGRRGFIMANETEVQEWFRAQLVGELLYPQQADLVGSVAVLPGQCNNNDCSTKCAHGTVIVMCSGGSISLRFDPYKLELLGQEIISVAKVQQAVIGGNAPSWPQKDT